MYGSCLLQSSQCRHQHFHKTLATGQLHSYIANLQNVKKKKNFFNVPSNKKIARPITKIAEPGHTHTHTHTRTHTHTYRGSCKRGCKIIHPYMYTVVSKETATHLERSPNNLPPTFQTHPHIFNNKLHLFP